MADVAGKFTAAEICPNIIPNPPQQKLELNFSGFPCELGNKFTTRQVVNAPRWAFNSDPEAIYSLIMIDPDNLSRQKPTVAEWLHWMVLNIPASNLTEGINGGQHVMAWGSPCPQPRTGEHRYVVLLWEHAGRRINQPAPSGRAKFKVKAFQEKHNLGDPIAGNFFISEHGG